MLNGGWISGRLKPPSGAVPCTLRQTSSISRFATTLRFAKLKRNVEDRFLRYFPNLALEVRSSAAPWPLSDTAELEANAWSFWRNPDRLNMTEIAEA
jgi:hypothetical protein